MTLVRLLLALRPLIFCPKSRFLVANRLDIRFCMVRFQRSNPPSDFRFNVFQSWWDTCLNNREASGDCLLTYWEISVRHSAGDSCMVKTSFVSDRSWLVVAEGETKPLVIGCNTMVPKRELQKKRAALVYGPKPRN
jgi:hypothetical protein